MRGVAIALYEPCSLPPQTPLSPCLHTLTATAKRVPLPPSLHNLPIPCRVSFCTSVAPSSNASGDSCGDWAGARRLGQHHSPSSPTLTAKSALNSPSRRRSHLCHTYGLGQHQHPHPGMQAVTCCCGKESQPRSHLPPALLTCQQRLKRRLYRGQRLVVHVVQLPQLWRQVQRRAVIAQEGNSAHTTACRLRVSARCITKCRGRRGRSCA